MSNHFCENCGNKITDGSNFCGGCGHATSNKRNVDTRIENHKSLDVKHYNIIFWKYFFWSIPIGLLTSFISIISEQGGEDIPWLVSIIWLTIVILYIYNFSKKIDEAMCLVGKKNRGYLGLLALVPFGFWICFFVVRKNLKPRGLWVLKENEKRESLIVKIIIFILVSMFILPIPLYYYYATITIRDESTKNVEITQTNHISENTSSKNSIVKFAEPTGTTRVTQATNPSKDQSIKINLVEYANFQCPACAAYAPLLRQVIQNNKSITFVFKHFPLVQIQKNSLIAAKATEAAKLQGKFWEMHDILFQNQEEWSGASNTYDLFLTYATTIGIDTKKFTVDIESKAIEDKVLADFSEGVSLGVQGIPTFFINGKKITNTTSYEDFDKIIKDEIMNQNQ